ncbi:uncharacterized protein [Amphiura filiformis]|uniref:uncharacterized protein n=1 Tax=Amphiura filiformis TaxID=82378 RepID=UPI003B214DDB
MSSTSFATMRLSPMMFLKRLFLILVFLGLCYCVQQIGLSVISVWHGSHQDHPQLQHNIIPFIDQVDISIESRRVADNAIQHVNQHDAKAGIPPEDEGKEQQRGHQQVQKEQKPKLVQQPQPQEQKRQPDADSGKPKVGNSSVNNKNKNPNQNKNPVQTVSKVKPYPVVLATTNSVFLDFTRNWLESIRRLKSRPKNITIVTEDEATYEALLEYPEVHRVKPAFMLPPNKTLVFDTPEYKAFVNKRPKYILDLLEHNHDVMFSDVDTVWLDDPFPYFTSDFDLFIQEDQPRPKLVLCAGFAYFRSSDSTKDFVRQWIRRLELNNHKKPDQMVLNIMLREKAIKRLKYNILDTNKFVSGRFYFDEEWRKNNTDVKPVFLHNNWIVGHDIKVERFKKLGYWYI